MTYKKILSSIVLGTSSLAAHASVLGGLGGDQNRAAFLSFDQSTVSGGLIRDAMHDDILAVTPKGAVGTYLAGQPGNAATIDRARASARLSSPKFPRSSAR